MKGRTITTVKHLNQLLENISNKWKHTSDTAELLSALEGVYLDDNKTEINLVLLTANDLCANNSAEMLTAMNKCLKLITTLAMNDHTDINRLITLLNSCIKTNNCTLSSCIGICATKKQQSELMEEYLQILLYITARKDVNQNEYQKLLSHHDERNDKPEQFNDGSLVFDLAEIARQDYNKRHLLQHHLMNLLRLADEGKIDVDTIYHALRTPKEGKQNLGILIAKLYDTPDCYMVYAKLLRHLRKGGFHIKKFLPKISDFTNVSKTDFLNYLKSRPASAQITEGMYFADPEDAAGKVMYDAQGLYDCELESGTLKDVTSIIGQRLVKNHLQAHQQDAIARVEKATAIVQPSAPPAEDNFNEATALFDKTPPQEYLNAPINEETRDPTILGTQLRLAAGYKRNDRLVTLVHNLRADVNYHRDIGDICADASPLYLAAEQNNLEGVKMLLGLGADVNCQRRTHTTALYIATAHNQRDVINVLLAAGADVDIITREKSSSLMNAVMYCTSDIVDAVVNRLCTKYANDPQGLKKFLEQDNHYRQCAEKAKSGGNLLSLLRLKDFLIENGIDSDEVNDMLPAEFTFKLETIKHEFMDALLLRDHAAQRKICHRIVNDPNSWEYQFARIKSPGIGLQPRSGAGMIGRAETRLQDYQEQDNKLINTIVKFGTEAQQDKGVSQKRLEEFRQQILTLLDAGADINATKLTNKATCWDGNTPLCAAASFGNVDLIKLVLSLGAAPDQRMIFTRTDLRIAIHRRAVNDDKIPLLCAYLDAHQEENISFLPEEFAALFGEHDAVAYLQSKRREKEFNAQPAAAPAAEVRAFVPPPFVAFVPPVAATEPPPPAYTDVMRMKAEEEKLAAELLEKIAAAEQAAAQSVSVYPALPAMNATYAAETQKIIEAGAKQREQAEVLPAQAVPVAVVKTKPDESKTEESKIADSFATLFSTSKASEPVMTDDLLSQPVISSVKAKPNALEESTLPVDFLQIDLLTFPAEAPKPTPSALDELIAAHEPTVIAPAKYINPFDDEVEVRAAPAAEKNPFNPFDIAAHVTEADLEKLNDLMSFDEPEAKPAISPNNPFINEQAQEAEAQRVFESLPSIPEKLKTPAEIFFPPVIKPAAPEKKQERVAVLAGQKK